MRQGRENATQVLGKGDRDAKDFVLVDSDGHGGGDSEEDGVLDYGRTVVTPVAVSD